MERNDFDFGIGHIVLLVLVGVVLLAALIFQQNARVSWLERQEQQPQILGEQTVNKLLPIECFQIPAQTVSQPRAEDPEYGQCY